MLPGYKSEKKIVYLNASNYEIHSLGGILLNPFFFLDCFPIHENRPTFSVSCRVEFICSRLGDFEDSELRSHDRQDLRSETNIG